MSSKELDILLEGLNEHMRSLVSFENPVSNKIFSNGWFSKEDILGFGITIDDENEDLRDELDMLNMRYLSQVSLWKSMYQELKNKYEKNSDNN